MEKNEYLPQEKTKAIVELLRLDYVPTFYVGNFISWDDCMSFIGKTELGGEYGEGIVVKNMTKLNNPNIRQPFYIKLVGESFQEHKKGLISKVIDKEKLKANEEARSLTETIVTEARVRKLLNKFVDEGILPENWTSEHMGIISKNLPRTIYEDCVKEENETVIKVANFGKFASGISMTIARNITNKI